MNGGSQPYGGSRSSGSTRRERKNRSGGGASGSENSRPMGGANQGEPKEGQAPNGGSPPQTSPRGTPPHVGDLYKDVWGHLPQRLRQEMDLYYREQFMPRYQELLRQYYSSLAERRRSTDKE